MKKKARIKNSNYKNKAERINIRIDRIKKQNWKKRCEEKNITISQLIIDCVENRLLEDERRKIMMFIENQENIFKKVENNINQFAKLANTQKGISDSLLKSFSIKMNEVEKLKKEQNEIFSKIYFLLGK